MSKLSVLIASFVALPVLAIATTVSATGAGQVEGGDIYRVRNVTTNTVFADPTSAKCNETVQFKVRIHNPGPSRLDNVSVVATLPSVAATSHISKATVSSPYADPTSTSDTATVNLNEAGKLAYVAGSTELLDAHNGKIKTLGDTITSTGVKVDGGVGVSIEEKRFVQFSAKVTCETEQPKNIKVCELSTKKIITIKENQFDSSKHSKNLADCATEGNIVVCELKTGEVVTIKESEFNSDKHSKDLTKCEETPETPEVLVNTGAGEILGLFAAVTVAGALGHRLFWTRIRG